MIGRRTTVTTVVMWDCGRRATLWKNTPFSFHHSLPIYMGDCGGGVWWSKKDCGSGGTVVASLAGNEGAGYHGG